MVAHRLDQPQGPDGDDLGGIFRDVERDLDVALGAEVVDFVGIDGFEHPPQSRTVGQVAIVQGQPGAADMGIVVEMIDAIGVEEACAPHHAVDFISFRKQEFAEVGAVLPGNAGDQRALCHAPQAITVPSSMMPKT